MDFILTPPLPVHHGDGQWAVPDALPLTRGPSWSPLLLSPRAVDVATAAAADAPMVRADADVNFDFDVDAVQCHEPVVVPAGDVAGVATAGVSVSHAKTSSPPDSTKAPLKHRRSFFSAAEGAGAKEDRALAQLRRVPGVQAPSSTVRGMRARALVVCGRGVRR
jgi:hypothetical protein